jgi:hypothetical protein
LSAGVDQLEWSMLECFSESEKKNDSSGLAAKAAEIGAANFQPVARFGALASSWQSIVTASSAEMHDVGF